MENRRKEDWNWDQITGFHDTAIIGDVLSSYVHKIRKIQLDSDDCVARFLWYMWVYENRDWFTITKGEDTYKAGIRIDWILLEIYALNLEWYYLLPVLVMIKPYKRYLHKWDLVYDDFVTKIYRAVDEGKLKRKAGADAIRRMI